MALWRCVLRLKLLAALCARCWPAASTARSLRAPPTSIWARRTSAKAPSSPTSCAPAVRSRSTSSPLSKYTGTGSLSMNESASGTAHARHPDQRASFWPDLRHLGQRRAGQFLRRRHAGEQGLLRRLHVAARPGKPQPAAERGLEQGAGAAFRDRGLPRSPRRPVAAVRQQSRGRRALERRALHQPVRRHRAGLRAGFPARRLARPGRLQIPEVPVLPARGRALGRDRRGGRRRASRQAAPARASPLGIGRLGPEGAVLRLLRSGHRPGERHARPRRCAGRVRVEEPRSRADARDAVPLPVQFADRGRRPGGPLALRRVPVLRAPVGEHQACSTCR